MNKYIFLILVMIFSSFVVSGALTDDNEVYYSFDEDNVSGTTMIDLSPNGIDATCFMDSGCDTVNGYILNASDFDGVDDYISFGNESYFDFDYDDSFSIGMWVKKDFNGAWELLYTKMVATGDYTGIQVFTNTDNTVEIQLVNDISPDQKIATKSNTTIDTNWHHVVFTYNGNHDAYSVKVYVDGVDVSNNVADTLGTNTLLNNANPIIGKRGDGFNFDGKIDEFGIWNRTLTSDEVEEWYNLTQNIYVPDFDTVSDSVESTAIVKQISPVNINNPSFSTVFSSDFNITVNNTDLYGAYSFNVESNLANTLFCELLIDGGVVGNVTRVQTPNVLGSVYLQSNIFTLENGTHSQELRCRRSVGGGTITITNSIGIGHILIDQNLEVVPHNESLFTASTTGSDYVLLDEFNFTISNRTTGGSDNLSHMLVLEWAGEYTNNDVVSEVLNTYISINGTNCSFYPRTVSSGGIGVVSGDCMIEGAIKNYTYPIKFYGKGNSADFRISIKAKEFILSPEEIEGGTGFPVPYVFSDNTETLIFNVTGGNLNHALTNVFQKNAFSISSDADTTAYFYVKLVNGTNYTTINFTRDITSDIGVLIGHDVLQNVPQDTYVSELRANCGTDGVNCTISGGDGIGYITDVTTTILNAFNIEVLDNYDNSSILNFSAVNGVSFSTTNGNLSYFYGDNELVNFTITSDYYGGYFNATIINHNVSNDLIVYLNQSIIKYDCVQKISNNDIGCPAESNTYNYNVKNNPITELILGTSMYFDTNYTFNVTALQNDTLTVEMHTIELNVNSSSSFGEVNNCTYNISSVSYSWSDSVTGNPFILTPFKIVNGSYSLTADCDGYALQTVNLSYASQPNNRTETYNFSLLTTNSVNITFYDINTLSILSGINITVQFIGSTSQTNITDTGILYVDLLNPSEYTLVFDADGYKQNTYIFTLLDKSFTELNLYMDTDNNTQLVLISVKDKFGKEVQSSDVIIQRYEGDAWKTEQIRRTDFQGRTEGYFVISDEFYNFLVEIDDIVYFGSINNNDDKKQIYAEDVNNGIEIIIDTSLDNTIENYQNLYGITIEPLEYYNTSNTTSYVRFLYDNSDNTAVNGTVKIYLDGVLDTSCSSTTESAIIICSFTHSDIGVGETLVKAVAFLDGEPVDSGSWLIGEDSSLRINWGSFGYFIALILIIGSFFAFSQTPSIGLLISSLVFSGLIVLGTIFRNVNLTIVSIIVSVAVIVIMIQSKGGD